MNTPELTMDPREADAAFREYRVALKREHTRADAWLCRVYRELRRQRRVLNIADAFRATGHDAKDRPLLALMRADQEHCWMSWGRRNDGPHGWEMRASQFGRRNSALSFHLDHDWLGLTSAWRHSTYRTTLPPIPPRFRPPQDKLHLYWMLWEAAWETVPHDPFLLRPLGGPFYAIVAQWDLTAAERAVLDFQGFNRRPN